MATRDIEREAVSAEFSASRFRNSGECSAQRIALAGIGGEVDSWSAPAWLLVNAHQSVDRIAPLIASTAILATALGSGLSPCSPVADPVDVMPATGS